MSLYQHSSLTSSNTYAGEIFALRISVLVIVVRVPPKTSLGSDSCAGGQRCGDGDLRLEAGALGGAVFLLLSVSASTFAKWAYFRVLGLRNNIFKYLNI